MNCDYETQIENWSPAQLHHVCLLTLSELIHRHIHDADSIRFGITA